MDLSLWSLLVLWHYDGSQNVFRRLFLLTTSSLHWVWVAYFYVIITITPKVKKNFLYYSRTTSTGVPSRVCSARIAVASSTTSYSSSRVIIYSMFYEKRAILLRVVLPGRHIMDNFDNRRSSCCKLQPPCLSRVVRLRGSIFYYYEYSIIILVSVEWSCYYLASVGQGHNIGPKHRNVRLRLERLHIIMLDGIVLFAAVACCIVLFSGLLCPFSSINQSTTI